MFKSDFLQGFGTQCLLLVLENWKNVVDEKKDFGDILTNLLESFDYVSHELLLAKLLPQEWSLSIIKMLSNYLLDCQTKTKVGSPNSAPEEAHFGVPKVSV